MEQNAKYSYVISYYQTYVVWISYRNPSSPLRDKIQSKRSSRF